MIVGEKQHIRETQKQTPVREVETYGSIDENGRLTISKRDQFAQTLTLLKKCRVRVRVEKLYKKRSLEQNGYYRGVICEAYKWGIWQTQQRLISNEEAHNELIYNCGSIERVNEDTGEVGRFKISTTKLSTLDAEEYYKKCRMFIFDWTGEDVPLPNEQSELEFNYYQENKKVKPNSQR